MIEKLVNGSDLLSKYDGVQHSCQTLIDVVGHKVGNISSEMFLCVAFSDSGNDELLGGERLLLLDGLVVGLGEVEHSGDGFLVVLRVELKIGDGERVHPLFLVQVEEHFLLEFVLLVGDGDGVVLTVEAVDERLDGGLVEVADVGGGLARLLPQHVGLREDEAEGVDDDLALDGLDGVDDDGDGARVELLKALLGVDVDAGEPAAKAGVGMVPADDDLRAAGLLEHVEHLGLEDGVDGLDGDAGAALRHGEHVDDLDGVVVDKLAQHEPHDLHGHAGAAVLEHLEQRERRDVHGLGGVHDGGVGVDGALALREHSLDAIHGCGGLRYDIYSCCASEVNAKRKAKRNKRWAAKRKAMRTGRRLHDAAVGSGSATRRGHVERW